MFWFLKTSDASPMDLNLKSRLLKAEFKNKLAENPAKKLIALYMHNSTHAESCQKFHKLLFEDLEPRVAPALSWQRLRAGQTIQDQGV